MKNKKTDRKLYNDLGEGDTFLLTDYTEDYDLYVKNQKILNDRKFGPGCNDSPLQFQKMKEIVLQTVEPYRFQITRVDLLLDRKYIIIIAKQEK